MTRTTQKKATRKRRGRPSRRQPNRNNDNSDNDIAARRNVEPVRRRRHADDDSPVLRFTPDAWAKLLWLRDRGETEIGGFGIAAPDDPLKIVEFVTVRQETTCASVQFDDEAVAEFFEQQFELGRRPEQFARTWIHTHPGESANPSALDEDTFARVFGVCDWAVMFIIARGGATYARLRFNVGPGGEQELPVRVAYAPPFPGSDETEWDAEYRAHVQPADEPALFGDLDPMEEVVASNDNSDGAWLDQFEIDPELMALLDGEETMRAHHTDVFDMDDQPFEDTVYHIESEDADDPAER